MNIKMDINKKTRKMLSFHWDGTVRIRQKLNEKYNLSTMHQDQLQQLLYCLRWYIFICTYVPHDITFSPEECDNTFVAQKVCYK